MGRNHFSIFCVIGFGLLGNIRSSAQTHNWEVQLFLDHTGAHSFFYQNKFTQSIYWAAIYISSPIGNFINATSLGSGVELASSGVPKFLFWLYQEIFPDIISKRIWGPEIFNTNLIRHDLTVGSWILGSYMIGGSPYIISFCVVQISISIYLLNAFSRKYFIAVYLFLCVLWVCSIFENYLSFPPFILSLPLTLLILKWN